MSLTDEEREEVHSSLTNLMEHGSRLDKENESLRARLKEYEDNPVPRELELLRKEGERVRMLDGQVQALASAMIDADEVVKQLRIQPKFLADSQWDYLQKLTDRVYKGASKRLVLRFPQLTPADSQLCMLIRLHFSNAQIATLIAVPPEEADDAGGWEAVCRRRDAGGSDWKLLRMIDSSRISKFQEDFSCTFIAESGIISLGISQFP